MTDFNGYDLLDTQADFMNIPHNSTLDVCCYQGGYGSGKTFIGSLLGITLALNNPGIWGLVGALTYSLVRDTTLVSYFQHLDNLGLIRDYDYTFLISEGKLQFSNGSVILFRHLEEPIKLKSLNLGFVEIEEMSDVPESTFNMLLARLRQKGIKQYRLFGHTNPENNKGWIYQNFIENPKHNYRHLIAPSVENTFLPEHFIKSMKDAYDPEYYKINVLGQFGNYTSGLVTKGFKEDNRLEKINYIDSMPLHISCDFNVDPMSWVICHKTDKAVYYIDEIVIENTCTAETVKEFISRYGEHKADIIINGDASGDSRSTSSEFTNYATIVNMLKEHFTDINIDVDIRGFNPPIQNRVAAWNAKMRNNNGDVGIYISKKCKWLLYNINNLKYKEGTSLIDTPSHHQIKNDRQSKFLGHIFDAASYIIEYYYPIGIKY